MHGYEMLTYLEDEGLTAVCPVEQSTFYTYLRNLEARNLVHWSEVRVGQRPPRKIFELTDQGQALIGPWLRQPVARMREVRLELLLKLYFLAQVDPEAHRTLLNQQIRVCEDYLARLQLKDPANNFTRLVLQSKRSAAEGTLGWLKQYAYELELEVT